MLKTIRAGWRIFAYLVITLILIPIQMVLVYVIKHKNPFLITRWYQGLCLKIFGVKLQVHGRLETDGPVMYVANHCSYMDIIVLGSFIKGSFIAKSEISKWPWFGFLAVLQRTVFIKRDRAEAAAQKVMLQEVARSKRNLIMFAEGTTSDGIRVLPFKSSLFSIADDMKYVQPLTIKFTALDGLPPGRTFQPVYGWYGDMELVSHLSAMLMHGELKVDVYCHQPIATGALPRKALAAKAEDAVRTGFLEQRQIAA